MSPRSVRALTAAAGIVVLAACSSSSPGTKAATTRATIDAAPEVKNIAITITETSCEPRRIETKAGPHTFTIKNDNAPSVTEFEVLYGNNIIGEAEQLGPGDDSTFSLSLGPGSYVTKCPNAKYPEGTLEVAPGAVNQAANTAAQKQAVESYHTYVQGEADALGQGVKPFAAAVKAGDIATAKRLYVSTRYHYELIEPIAESFGDLDPAIDIREADTTSPAEFTGFHRIEKALWHDNSLAGLAPVADKLVADITELRNRIAKLKLQPEQIANGAVELLNEMSTTKITGEEDTFSHTDLSDFAANLAGAKAAFQSVRTVLASTDVPLTRTINDRFIEVQDELNKHQSTDPIGNGFQLYDTLTPEQTRALSSVLDTLAEPMSKVAAKLL